MNNNKKFKETEIGLIPEEWGFDILGNHCKVIGGKRLPKEDRLVDNKTDHPYIRITDFGDFKVNESGLKYISNETHLKIKKYIIENGDIYISNVGTIGLVGLISNNLSGANLTENAVRLIKLKGLNNLFAGYYLKSEFGQCQIIQNTVGAVQPKLPIYGVENIKIPIPSMEEQQKIAEILSSLDDKIELNQNINNNLEKIASSLFKRWFVDFEFSDKDGKPYKSSGGKMIDSELGEIPENFVIDAIGNKLKTVLGGTPSRSNDDYWKNGSIPWINSGAINNFPVLEQSEFITVNALKNSAAKLMPVKTVILPFVISVGKPVNISILGIEASGNQSVLGVLANDDISAEYVYYWISNIKDKIYSCATGGAQQHINKRNVDESIIIIPTKEIIDNFDKITKHIFDSIILNSHESLRWSKLRDSLLPKLMNGKIRVKI